MLYWAVVFLIISIVAGILGFGGVSAAAGIAKVLFFIFVVLFVVTLLIAVVLGRKLAERG